MNLGTTFLNVFFEISVSALGISGLAVVGLRCFKKIRTLWLLALFFFVAILLVYVGNGLFHQRIFASRHQAENQVMPQANCISYKPSFNTLYASYEMTRGDFEKWIETHPWEMALYDLNGPSLVDHDASVLGFNDPVSAYATEMAGNGKQLRVYFRDNIVYVSYNSM